MTLHKIKCPRVGHIYNYYFGFKKCQSLTCRSLSLWTFPCLQYLSYMYLNCCWYIVSLCFFFLLHPLPAFFSKLLFFTFYKLHAKVLINTGGAFVTLIDWHFYFFKCQRTLVPTCNMYLFLIVHRVYCHFCML